MKNIKKLGLSIMMAVSALGLMACGTPAEAVKLEEQPGVQALEVEQEADTSITITHELGETTLDKNPQKVIVFDYGLLDALDKMEEDIIGLPMKNLPGYLNKYEGEDYVDVGSLQEPNFETIYELQPDLILISGRQRDLYGEFTRIAPTIFLTIDGADYMGTFKTNMAALGEIFDKKEVLDTQVEKIEKVISEVNEKASSNDKNALFIMANDGNLSAFGAGSRFGLIYNELGVTAIDDGIEITNHGDKISFEYIVEKDPDYLYIMDRAAVAGGDISAKQVMDNDLIKSTSAYKNDRITYLDAHNWYVSAGGIKSTMKMVEEIQESLQK